jgi:hypothetical protein
MLRCALLVFKLAVCWFESTPAGVVKVTIKPSVLFDSCRFLPAICVSSKSHINSLCYTMHTGGIDGMHVSFLSAISLGVSTVPFSRQDENVQIDIKAVSVYDYSSSLKSKKTHIEQRQQNLVRQIFIFRFELDNISANTMIQIFFLIFRSIDSNFEENLRFKL